MGSIPFSSAPIPYLDKDTGIKYLLKPPCGDTEILLMELSDTLPQEQKKRREFFEKNHREAAKFIDSSIDTVLCGWESGKVKLPAFPSDGKPSQMMKSELKVSVLAYYNSQKEFTGDEIKK